MFLCAILKTKTMKDWWVNKTIPLIILNLFINSNVNDIHLQIEQHLQINDDIQIYKLLMTYRFKNKQKVQLQQTPGI